jgi:hypothetical protein
MIGKIPTRKKACSLLTDWMKENEGCHYKDGWLHAGNVGIDTGRIIIKDKTHSSEKYADGLWEASNRDPFNIYGLNFTAHVAGGDGVFPVLVKLTEANDRIGIDKILINLEYEISCDGNDINMERDKLGKEESCSNVFDFLEKTKD